MKQRHSGLPFDDFRNLIEELPDANEAAAEHTRGQFDESLLQSQSKISELCEWYSRWSGRSPVVHRPLLTLFAGTHTVLNKLDDGANADWLLSSVTAVAEGNAPVNRLCHQYGLGLKLFDLALQMPVADIAKEAALDEKSCAGTIAFGMEAIAGGSDLLSVCAIEKGAGPSALAILAASHDLEVDEAVSGFSDVSADFRKQVQSARENVVGHENDGLETLRRLGGRETSAICGAILSARVEHVPAIVGGLSGLAACAVLHRQNPGAIAHCVFASRFDNPPLDDVINKLGLITVLDKPFSPVYGDDVVMASGLVQSACKHLSPEGQATSG